MKKFMYPEYIDFVNFLTPTAPEVHSVSPFLALKLSSRDFQPIPSLSRASKRNRNCN